MEPETQESLRLKAARKGQEPWKKWGPYLSERQWGTVREDYSENGDAWNFFTHDQARSRAYRWGEDGLAGLCPADAGAPLHLQDCGHLWTLDTGGGQGGPKGPACNHGCTGGGAEKYELNCF